MSGASRCNAHDEAACSETCSSEERTQRASIIAAANVCCLSTSALRLAELGWTAVFVDEMDRIKAFKSFRCVASSPVPILKRLLNPVFKENCDALHLLTRV